MLICSNPFKRPPQATLNSKHPCKPYTTFHTDYSPQKMSAQDEPSSVSTTLLYFTPPTDGSKPWLLVTKPDPASGIPSRNFEQAKVELDIRNLRGHENSVSLDKEGFQYGVHPAKHTTFANDAEIEAEYYPESIELLKQVTGASRVVLFDHSAFFSCRYITDSF